MTTRMQTVEDAKKSIREAIASLRHGGHYAHNMTSSTLRWVAGKYGAKKANQLVREFDLARVFGIQEEKE